MIWTGVSGGLQIHAATRHQLETGTKYLEIIADNLSKAG
jgi:hypothetical protein